MTELGQYYDGQLKSTIVHVLGESIHRTLTKIVGAGE